MLYAGTTKPIPRREFDEHAPNLSVNSLADEDSPVRAPFSKPEVQYIGSTWLRLRFPSLDDAKRRMAQAYIRRHRAGRQSAP
jgi:hypothetical protein